MRPRIVLGSIAVVLGACGEPPAPPRPAASDGDEARAAREREERAAVEDLMALPYAGWVEEDEETAAREGLIAFDASRSCPGYTLYSVYSLGRAMLVDHAGVERIDPRADGAEITELSPGGRRRQEQREGRQDEGDETPA